MLNTLAVRVLRLLADAEFHSGSTLARALDVSRGTIWNAVKALEEAGVEIFRVRARGYRLPRPLSMLDPQAIRRTAPGYAIEVLDCAESTNTALMGRIAAGAPGRTVLACEWQSGGRGRLGRPWHAQPGGSLTFSLLWRFNRGAGALAGLSLAAGVALARAIEKLGARGVRLKWPNDVVWDTGKLAGMLIEMQGDALGPSAVVIGIGVNVRLAPSLRARIDQESADLETACGRAVDRNAALGLMLSELDTVLEGFSDEGFAPLRSEWEHYHLHQGRAVDVRLPGGRSDHGIVRGVGEDGALLLDSGGSVRRLHSGEISVRGAQLRRDTARARGGA